MKHLLLTTIVAVVLVGCGSRVDINLTGIWKAAEQGNIEAVKQHLATGTDVNAKEDQLEMTPLHRAALNGLKEIAELLIAASADANAKMRNGRTALDKAKQHPEITDLLRKHGGKTGEELKVK